MATAAPVASPRCLKTSALSGYCTAALRICRALKPLIQALKPLIQALKALIHALNALSQALKALIHALKALIHARIQVTRLLDRLCVAQSVRCELARLCKSEDTRCTAVIKKKTERKGGKNSRVLALR
jgi:hypothetical protein